MQYIIKYKYVKYLIISLPKNPKQICSMLLSTKILAQYKYRVQQSSTDSERADCAQ